MKKLHILKRSSFLFLPLLLIVGLLPALPRTAAAQDPPGRVARLNFIEGAVSLEPAGTQDWVYANPNRPLTTGDNLWLDEGSRGELHIGSASFRLSSQTGISFLNLNDQAVQIQVAQGSLNVRLRQLNEDEAYEIDTPNLAFSLLRPGEYRIDVDPNQNTTTVTVWSGSGEVTGGGVAYSMGPREQGTFSGSTPLSYDSLSTPDPDDFDNWCVSRDHHEDRSASARYVSREVIGYEDLDTYGSWRRDPVYGNVWVPSGVEVGWAPYRYGHWVYVVPWGWTWVDDAPWGFAPFHYGRWAFTSFGWVWVPGSVAVVAGGPYVRPVYAPALVAFVGGGGFSLAVGIGGGVVGVAWIPLGPRDVWVPSYRASAAYVQNVNISNSTVINKTQITNVYNTYNTTTVNNVTVTNITYMNQSTPGAVTAVPKEAFTAGKPVAAVAVKMSPEQIQHPQLVEKAPVAPTPKSAVGAAPPAKASAKPPAALANRPVVTKLTPSPQVVPIGHTQSIAKSNLAKPAPPATPTSAPPAATNKPAGQPARKVQPPPSANPSAPGKPAPATPAPGAPAAKPNAPPSETGKPAPAKPPTPPPGAPTVKPTPPPGETPKPVPPPKSTTPPPGAAPAKPNAPPSEAGKPAPKPATPPPGAAPAKPNAPPNEAGKPAQPPKPATPPPGAAPAKPNAPPNEAGKPAPTPKPATPPPGAAPAKPNAPPSEAGKPAPTPKPAPPAAKPPEPQKPPTPPNQPPKKAEPPPKQAPPKEQPPSEKEKQKQKEKEKEKPPQPPQPPQK